MNVFWRNNLDIAEVKWGCQPDPAQEAGEGG